MKGEINILPPVNQRIMNIIKDRYNGSVRQFSMAMGITEYQKINRLFSIDKRNDQYPAPSINILSTISNTFNVSLDWLETGEGNMLKGENLPNQDTEKENYQLVPLYNFDAVGGMNTSCDVIDSAAYVERHIPFSGAKSGDIAIHVTGNSMIPTYIPGSIVLVREVHNWREYFGYGNAFVIFLSDGRRILKTVQKSIENNKEYVLCTSINSAEYPEEELPRSMIVCVYKVVMSLTNEGF